MYKDSNIDRNFVDRCKVQDPSGHDFFLGENDSPGLNGETNLLHSNDDELFQDIDSQNNELVETSVHPAGSDEDENAIDREDRAYSEYAKTDPIKRFQFDYDEHVALSSVFSAAHVDGNTLTKSIHCVVTIITILLM